MNKRLVIISAKGKDTLTVSQQERLEAVAHVHYHQALEPLSVEALVELLQEADVTGLTPRSVPLIAQEWIDRVPRLQGIAVFATGVDYIDMELLHERNILLSHLPDYSMVSVAEHTIGLLLTISRRIALSQDRIKGRVPQTTSLQGWELSGKTIGIVGLGRIGSYVAGLCKAFGMKVLGYDTKDVDLMGVEKVNLEELLLESDIVSLHMPIRWKGQAMIGKPELKLMKEGSCLINVSRAALVDELSVVHAIESGHLKSYAVDDIFSLQDRASTLINEGRIIQTGHTAWYSSEVITRGYEGWVNNMIGLCTGQPVNLVLKRS